MGSLELQRKLDGISTGESVSLRIEPSEVSDFFSALESRDTALSKVKNLELGGCDLRTLPESFGNLTALRVLSLARNRLTSLPDSIGNLTDLKSLYLYNNELTALPNSFFNLRCLEELFLHFNRLTALPATFGQLTALRYLDAHLNQLHDLPQSFNELRALTHLNISRNEFRSLPRTACRLPSLAELFVAGNQLETLPEGVGTLGSLEVLSIARNHVDSLPDSIGHLSKLTTFFASDNRLSALPASMEQMRSLRSLFLHENPALELPPEVLGPPWIECKGHGGTAEPAKPQEILSFYFARSAAAARGELAPIHEVKVMLVGRGGAGKTSLRRFFLGQRHDPKEAETPGIALDTLERTCGGKRIKLHLWDFAGQEITHALHQFFLTGGSVYVLVLDPRSNTEMADAFYWLDQLSRFAPGAPVVVALNRQDSRIGGYDVDRNQLLERYPQIRSFVPTNCESRAGCEDLLQAITQVIEAQPKDELPWLDVPREWLSVKDTCWRMGNRDGGPTAKNAGSGVKHKLKFSEFQTLCADNKITEKERQESLARILHRLGAVLHFVDDPRLRDTSVLDPHWVTDGVYRLIRAKDKPKSDGLLRLDEAVNALPDKSVESARFLLRLMERFEMCYPVEVDGNDTVEQSTTWLVPGSLDPYQPEGLGEQWKGPGAVRLRYDYRSPVAEGIIPRFIVLTHALHVKGDALWRNGVVIRDGEAAALVRVRRGDAPNFVEVAALGPAAARLRLLEVVQGAMNRINADLPGKPPTIEKELDGLPEAAGSVFKPIADLRAAEQAEAPIIVGTTPPPMRVEPTQQLDVVSERSTREQRRKPLRAFLSYSHQDRRAKNEFVVNMLAMQAKELILSWHDGMIEPGTEWQKEIETQLESMDIFIGLLTNHFVTSSFIQRVELAAARKRLKDRGKREFVFVLVLVDDIPLEGLDLSQYQILKPAHRAVCKHKSKKDGFNEAQREIEKLIRDHMKKDDDDNGKPVVGLSPDLPPGGTSGVTVIHVSGDFVHGGKHMRDDRRINIGGNVTNSQVGQTLTNCTNLVNQQAPGAKKDAMNTLRQDVEELIKALPAAKVDDAPQIAENLELALKQAAKDKPDRKWYSVSAEGLMEAAGWVEGFTGKIGGAIKNLGTSLFPDFQLPKTGE